MVGSSSPLCSLCPRLRLPLPLPLPLPPRVHSSPSSLAPPPPCLSSPPSLRRPSDGLTTSGLVSASAGASSTQKKVEAVLHKAERTLFAGSWRKTDDEPAAATDALPETSKGAELAKSPSAKSNQEEGDPPRTCLTKEDPQDEAEEGRQFERRRAKTRTQKKQSFSRRAGEFAHRT